MNLSAGSHLPNNKHNAQSCKFDLLTLSVPGTRLPIRTHGQVSVAKFVQPALVNGVAGVVAVVDGRLVAVTGFTVRGGKIVEIDVVADPARLRRIDLGVLDD